MAEKFCPQPENPKQHAPEEGAGPLGIPPPDPEQQPQGGESKRPEGQQLEQHGAVFECAIPRVIPSPFHLRLMVREGRFIEEQAQEVEQQWREYVKTWDRQRLERAISSVEERRESYANRNNQRSLQAAEYELEALRTELRRRE